ncbi:MAG TPA: glycosyltransferase family 39 protein [Casimicrobiaceae bacterium]
MNARAGSAAVVAVVAFAYVALGGFVGGGYDPGRDVAEAYAIVHDGARPLLGPLVAGHVRLGPVWYYLLALPMSVVPAWFTAAMTAVLVGALQFPLAYAAGRRLADRRLGMLWVAALAMPSYASFESVGFASTNAVRTATLATLYCLLRARDTPRLLWWLAAGLAASAATHAHPSCAWLLAVVLAAAAWRPALVTPLLRERGAALLAAVAGMTLLFVPALFAPSSLLDTTRALAATNVSAVNLLRAPALLWSVAWSGPHAIMAAVFAPAHAFADNVATLAALLGLAGALRGLSAALAGQRAARWGLALCIAAVMFVALVRPFTPVYMTYSIIPCYALLVASGWHRLADTRPLAMFTLPVLFAAALAGVGVVHAMRDGGGRIDTQALADVTHPPSPTPVATDIWLYAASVDPLGRALCADPMPVYGALAYALDVFYAMPLRLHCPAQIRRFTDEAPAAAARGKIALAMRRYRELRIVPAMRVGGLGIDPVTRIIAAPPHRDLPLDARYPPHAYAFGAPTRIDYAFDAAAAELVVVSNPRVTWMPAWDSDVRCGGVRVAPATTDLVTRVYRCASGQQANRWVVATMAADPRALEVVTFTPRVR